MIEIIKQLCNIYYTEEWWHKIRMNPEEAFKYHKEHYENGDIYTYIENGEVLGYFERYFDGNKCILFNVYVEKGLRRGRVFKELYKHFFKTMPKHIEFITGEKQRLGGKFQKVKIRS